MDHGILVPISLFGCVAYSIKAVVDARTRGKLLTANRSDDLIRAILLTDESRRRHSALHWGIVLSCLAGGFALIELIGWREITPGVIGVLLAATGVGNIISYFIARAFDARQRSEFTEGRG
jgi:uncharacterized membrane protein HdeD (DUF308 family)